MLRIHLSSIAGFPHPCIYCGEEVPGGVSCHIECVPPRGLITWQSEDGMLIPEGCVEVHEVPQATRDPVVGVALKRLVQQVSDGAIESWTAERLQELREGLESTLAYVEATTELDRAIRFRRLAVPPKEEMPAESRLAAEPDEWAEFLKHAGPGTL